MALRKNVGIYLMWFVYFPSYSKIQSVFELSDGSGLAVTVARYETPAHTDIDKVYCCCFHSRFAWITCFIYLVMKQSLRFYESFYRSVWFRIILCQHLFPRILYRIANSIELSSFRDDITSCRHCKCELFFCHC